MRKIAVVIKYDNENVSPFETIDAIKKQDLRMFLLNGIIKIGSLVNKNN